jgi:hypothetical protein
VTFSGTKFLQRYKKVLRLFQKLSSIKECWAFGNQRRLLKTSLYLQISTAGQRDSNLLNVINTDGDYDSLVDLVVRYELEWPGIEFRWGEFFRTRTDRPWVQPGPSTMDIGSFPGANLPGNGSNYPHISSVDVKRKIGFEPLAPHLVFHKLF